MDAITQALLNAVDEEEREIKQRAEAAAQRASKRYMEHDIQRRQEIMENVAATFYKDYEPKYYTDDERRGTLYRILRVTRLSNDEYEIDFDPSLMTYRGGKGGGEENLYNTVFRYGWHGGAPSGPAHPKNGTPMWRYPYPYYTKWGNIAARSTSPLQEFLRLDDEETEYDAELLLRRYFDEEWSAEIE